MTKQQPIPRRLLYSISPEMLAQMNILEDLAGDESDWDESVGQYDGDALAVEMLGAGKPEGEWFQ